MKIVVTGSPGIGKTTMTKLLAREFAPEIVVRGDGLSCIRQVSQLAPSSSYSKKCELRAAFHLMVELENMLSDIYRGRAIFCDGGTLDCLNQWPGAAPSFFEDVRSDLNTELSRYDWVLDICSAATPTQNFWRRHRQYISVPASDGFSVCTMEIGRAVKAILDGQSLEDVQQCLKLKSSIAGLYERQ